jgi:SRSO17 transposase
MTAEQIRALGAAFAAELRRYRGCFGQDRTAAHFDTYCRGLLSDLPRKTVEPIALAAGHRNPAVQDGGISRAKSRIFHAASVVV